MARALSNIIQKFGNSTSMHGVPNAIRARSTLGRVVWVCACLVATAMFTLQLSQLLKKYLDNPKKVVIDFVPLAVPFPSISLCNMRNLDNIVLNKLNKIFKTQDNITYMLQVLEEMEREELEHRNRDKDRDREREREDPEHRDRGMDIGGNMQEEELDPSYQNIKNRKENLEKLKLEETDSSRKIDSNTEHEKISDKLRRRKRDKEKYENSVRKHLNKVKEFNKVTDQHGMSVDYSLDNSNNKHNRLDQSSLDKQNSYNSESYTDIENIRDNNYYHDSETIESTNHFNKSSHKNQTIMDKIINSLHPVIQETNNQILNPDLAPCSEILEENERIRSQVDLDLRSILRGVKLNSFIGQYLKTFAKHRPIARRDDIDPNIIHTVLSRTTMATNIDRGVLTEAGVSFTEFMVSCRFGGESCNRTRDFQQFFDSYYYNCFTYEAPGVERESEDSSLAEGLEIGWSSILLTGSSMLDKNERIRRIPGTHQFLSPMSSSEGVRVVIHPRGTEPYPHTEGFDVPPGYSASFGVKARQNIRLGAPYGNCSYDNPFQTDKFDYRMISCQKHCLQKAIVRTCGCKDILLPGQDLYPQVKYCADDQDIPDQCRNEDAGDECLTGLYTIYKRFVCVREVSARVARSNQAIRDCQCYPACSEITYDVSYSLSRWPAESFDGDEVYLDVFDTEKYYKRFQGPGDEEKEEVYSRHFDECNRREAMRDFARLNVYIADSNVIKTEEQVDYTSTQLLADIGGQLGLWVGVSVITLAEVLEFLVELLKYFSVKYGPYDEGRKQRRQSFIEADNNVNKNYNTSDNSASCGSGGDFRHYQTRFTCGVCAGRFVGERGSSFMNLPHAVTEVDIENGGQVVSRVKKKKRDRKKYYC